MLADDSAAVFSSVLALLMAFVSQFYKLGMSDNEDIAGFF